MGQIWDAFYVLLDEEGETVKFGITSGDARPRLASHLRDGYCNVVRLMSDLPLGVARGLERDVIATLKLAGIGSIRGREYFPATALPVVLDIADHYPVSNFPALVPAARSA